MSVMALERYGRRRKSYAADAAHPRLLRAKRLSRGRGITALCVGLIPILVGFVFPANYLVHATATRIQGAGVSPAIVVETGNTLLVSAAGTLLTTILALVVVYAARLSRSRWSAAVTQTASAGYAVPGIVLAIGLLPVVTGVDIVLLTSGVAIVIAYAIRFLAIGVGGIEAGFKRVPLSVDDAARTLGETPAGRLRRIHLPLIRPALATSAMLVFVDCMKELPVTLLLRPVGFETLATHLYGDAVRGTYEDAAIAALLIVVVGLLPVLVLSRLAAAELGTQTSGPATAPVAASRPFA
jgi:iron(III) transport system permease protein